MELRLLPFIAMTGLLQIGPQQVNAQRETDKWYFGSNGEGLDFTGHCDPAPLGDGGFYGFEGCSTVADRNTGELLFYTNSEQVYGRDHLVMPNGSLHVSGSVSENTITQVLITSRPGSDVQYYVFTNQIQGGSVGGGGMRMACVDMTLNGGNGDVVFKDSVVYADTVSEKVAAVKHANGTDLWVIGHAYPGDEFFSLRITPNGPVYPAVISAIGKHYGGGTMDCLGEMKADPRGDRIAVVTSGQPHVELYRFNRMTGAVSDRVAISSPEIATSGNSWLYGVSFSPSGSKLYAARKNFGLPIPSLIQVDVSSHDSLEIAASYTVISTLDSIYGIHLGPNGKIYARRADLHLGAIHFPDNAGLACDFDPEAITFLEPPGPMGTWGLNNNITLAGYPCLSLSGSDDDHKPPLALIHPVPTDGDITVTVPEIPRGGRLVLRDLLGRTVSEHPLIRSSTQLTIQHSGTWFLELWDAQRRLTTMRVIRQ
ncbi:MAG: hypothetical protein JNN32_04385 [Flavobacteriales bacterium]|nr:hypothetical protein [Flavobacteriales bacterium]